MMTENSQQCTKLILLALFLSGCQFIESFHQHHQKEPELLGVVETGGQFARADSLPIPACGLTLGQAVEQVLRPGIEPAVVIPAAPPSTVSPPAGQQRVVSVEDALTALKGVKDRNIRADVLLQPLLESIASNFVNDTVVPADQVVLVRAQIRALLLFHTSSFKPAADPSELEALARKITALIDKKGLEDLAQETNDALAVESRPAQREALSELGAKISEELDQPADGATRSNQPPKTDPVPPQSNTTSTNSSSLQVAAVMNSVYYEAAVVLTRKTGRRIVAPLWLVQTYSAGDIALQDGDIVEVTPLQRTSVGVRGGAGAANVLVSGMAGGPQLVRDFKTLSQLVDNIQVEPELRDFADLVILRHTTANGGFEEYLIPRTGSNVYGNSLQNDLWSRKINLSSGDIVSVSNLDLHPLIQDSKSAVRAAKVAQIYDEYDIRQNGSLSDAVRQIPIIGQLHGAIKQTTGIDDATLSQSMQQTHEALGVIPSSIGLPTLAQ